MSDNKPKRFSFQTFFGLFLLIGTVLMWPTRPVILSLCTLTMGLIVYPPSSGYMTRISNGRINLTVRRVIFLIALVIGGIVQADHSAKLRAEARAKCPEEWDADRGRCREEAKR